MNTSNKPYTARELEDYVVGELAAERAAVIEAAAEEDESLSQYLESRKSERAAFLHDPRRRNFQSLVDEAGVEKKRAWFALPALALAGGIAAAVVLMPTTPTTPSNTGGIRTKGGISVQAAVLAGERPELFDATKALHPGDRIRLTVDDPTGGYVTVILEESSGAVDVLYRPTELGELRPGSHMLPDSLELDDKLGRERIYVIMSNEAQDPKAWLEEIRASHAKAGFGHGWLPPGGTRVGTIEYEKVDTK
ncbi:MAG: DUF4384 domain-containing protein [Deltaproteobacteria bacterium]|jgi:hypothetical protein